MKFFTHITRYVLTAAVLSVIVAAPGLVAADELICPDVYPCDDAGELLAMFEGQTDDCSVKFAARCKAIRAEGRKSCAAVSERYNDLQETVEAQKTKYTKLQRKFKKLKNSK